MIATAICLSGLTAYTKIEYVFGIRADVPTNTLWVVRLTDAFGVKKYPFGKNGIIDLQCAKRKKITDKPMLKIKSNIAFNLLLKWNGGSQIISIKKT